MSVKAVAPQHPRSPSPSARMPAKLPAHSLLTQTIQWGLKASHYESPQPPTQARPAVLLGYPMWARQCRPKPSSTSAWMYKTATATHTHTLAPCCIVQRYSVPTMGHHTLEVIFKKAKPIKNNATNCFALFFFASPPHIAEPAPPCPVPFSAGLAQTPRGSFTSIIGAN